MNNSSKSGRNKIPVSTQQSTLVSKSDRQARTVLHVVAPHGRTNTLVGRHTVVLVVVVLVKWLVVVMAERYRDARRTPACVL